MNKKELNELKDFAQEITKPVKWKSCYMGEEKGAELKIDKPNERLCNIFTHEVFRKIYLISGTPLPDKFRFKLLYTNHSRKRFKRKR